MKLKIKEVKGDRGSSVCEMIPVATGKWCTLSRHKELFQYDAYFDFPSDADASDLFCTLNC